MGALIKYDNGERLHLKKAVRYVDSKKHGRLLIDPFPSGFSYSTEDENIYAIKLGCCKGKLKFENGIVIATDENLGQLSVGFRGLNLDAELGDGGSPNVIILPGMLDFSLPGYRE